MAREFRAWVCLCGPWYAGSETLPGQVYETIPTEEQCHRWDCGYATVTYDEIICHDAPPGECSCEPSLEEL